MSDQETIEVYAKAAEDYAKGFADTKEIKQEDDIRAFLEGFPDGARVLDYGCGPGQWAAVLRDRGCAVDATDATQEMADLARDRYGIAVRVEPFEALDAEEVYHGIWANFSLLHAPRDAIPGLLTRVHRALRPDGRLHIGMKIGTGEGRDRLGRFYTYYGEDELKGLLTDAGFTVTRTRTGSGKGLAGGEETFVVMTADA